MEDGVKEDPAKPKEVKATGKAGWLKKASGKFLASYKDRYIQLDRTEMAVYDSEDLKNCVERLDLENFDKCHELRSPFKKKNRLILIRTPKSGSKVYDVKLQAQNQEEKDAWIKALSDGINRAKNKIFDEVKIDESSSLEHVTRSRPKGNRGRRPPTRIHMKEAANISSDGILRLDLDTVDSMPNGTHTLSAEGSDQKDTAKPQAAPAKSFDDIPEEAEDKEPAPQKKVVKPPMPPSKEKKSSETQESEAPQKKVLVPPMPPSKEKKPSETTEEEEPGEVMQEKKVLKPPIPPSKDNKPSISANEENTSDSGVESGASSTPSKVTPTPEETDDTEPCESAPPKNTANAPPPPSKDKKPTQELILKDQENAAVDDDDVDDQDDEDGEDAEAAVAVDVSVDSQKAADVEEEEEEKEETVKTEDTAFTLSNKVLKPQGVMWDLPSTNLEESGASAGQDANKPTIVETTQSVAIEPAKPASQLKSTPHSTPETVKKAPPAPPKKKPVKPPVKVEDSGLQSGPVVCTSSALPAPVTSTLEKDGKPDAREPNAERKVVVLSLSNPGANEESEDVSGAEVEEKSIDSGQLSAEDSESGDQVTSSTDKLQGLGEETSDDDLESSDSKVPSMDDPSPAILRTVLPEPTVEASSTSPAPHSAAPLTSKTRSASTGDLLEIQVVPQECEMKDLRRKVSLEIKETGKLLGELGPSGDKESSPEILLATAMEKLKQADQFLREAKNFKELENKSKRTSW
ncbi:uncharacterized protein plekho2 [Salminus brasiliensis]|uniref:uncharacterized protein plekho2 n=1 Tax=Salminus brasiliensis TaxID=930266 RepID=UPI003B82F6AD